MEFVYFRIIDQNIAPDNDVYLLLIQLYARVQKGEVLYIHCWGGHGRAGTVAACLMAMCEGLSPAEALDRTQKYHDTRLETTEYPSKVDVLTFLPPTPTSTIHCCSFIS
jgi:alanine transaminase